MAVIRHETFNVRGCGYGTDIYELLKYR